MILYKTLGLWHSITNKLLLTHADLEPIMKDLGFVMRPGRETWFDGVQVEWIEYRYEKDVTPTEIKEELQSKTPPIVELPRDSIHGLHPFTYQAFGHALDYYHKRPSDSATEEFDVRTVLFGQNAEDIEYIWMDTKLFGDRYIYRCGTFDPKLFSRYTIGDLYAIVESKD